MPRILLVEDDINLREIYAARLTAEGYEVVSASDGEEALAKSVKEKPDLILLDIMMPKISGFDVLDILRSTPETKQTKVVILTALSQKSDRERGEGLGVNRYLIKSQITLEDVVQTIREVLGVNVSEETIKAENDGQSEADVASEIEEAIKDSKVKIDIRNRLTEKPPKAETDETEPGKPSDTAA